MQLKLLVVVITFLVSAAVSASVLILMGVGLTWEAVLKLTQR